MTKKTPVKKSRAHNRGPGPTFTTAGAIPGSSEIGWKTAYPDADATKPDSMPAAIAATMKTDPDVEEMSTVDAESQGPEMSMAGAMPGGSEIAWDTAYPSADATKPETMPSSMEREPRVDVAPTAAFPRSAPLAGAQAPGAGQEDERCTVGESHLTG